MGMKNNLNKTGLWLNPVPFLIQLRTVGVYFSDKEKRVGAVRSDYAGGVKKA
jgi:hypothetical protein